MCLRFLKAEGSIYLKEKEKEVKEALCLTQSGYKKRNTDLIKKTSIAHNVRGFTPVPQN